ALQAPGGQADAPAAAAFAVRVCGGQARRSRLRHRNGGPERDDRPGPAPQPPDLRSRRTGAVIGRAVILALALAAPAHGAVPLARVESADVDVVLAGDTVVYTRADDEEMDVLAAPVGGAPGGAGAPPAPPAAPERVWPHQRSP